MSYTADQVIQGIINYADAEVINKLPTSGKWIVGTAIGLATTKTTSVIDTLRNNTLVTMLGIVDDNGNIDVDTLISSMRVSAEKYGKITVDVPLVGKLTFSASDVDTLRNYIG